MKVPKTGFAIVIATALWLPAGLSWAGDTTDAPTLVLYPTYHALGIATEHSGDDNGNADATLEYRLNGGAWAEGPRLVHTEIPNRSERVFRASVFPLESGTAVDVRVVITDPDNPTPVELSDSTVVRTWPNPSPRQTYYVSSDGNDGASGLSEATAWRSVTHALAQVSCGDLVLVGPGVYRERLFFTNQCTPDAPLVFQARQADVRPVLDNGTYLAPGSNGWELVQDDVYVRDEPVAEDKVIRVLTVDSRRAKRYEALSDLLSDSTSDLRLGRCYYQERISSSARRIYLRTGFGDSPSAHEIAYSLNADTPDGYRDRDDNPGVVFEGSQYVVLDGFEVRHSGGRGAIFRRNASHNKLTNCLLHSNYVQVEMQNGIGNLLWGNELHVLGTGDYASGYFYDPRTEDSEAYVTLLVKGDHSQSIVGNRMHDGWDLVQAWFDWEEQNRGESDIAYNVFWNTADDAVELDGAGVNVRVFGNQFRNVFTGVSVAPIRVGPTYVARNTLTYNFMLFKHIACDDSPDQDGDTFIWHNSAYPLLLCPGEANAIAAPYWTCEGQSPAFGNKHYRNNVSLAGNKTIMGRPGLDLDTNLYGPLPDTEAPFYWPDSEGNNIGHSFPEFQSLTGLESHGWTLDQLGVSDPAWTATAGLRATECTSRNYVDFRYAEYPASTDPFEGVDFEPLENSVVLDRGESIPGFNDGFTGEAPDLGAIEFGANTGGAAGFGASAAGSGGSAAGGRAGAAAGGTAGIAATGGSQAAGASAGSPHTDGGLTSDADSPDADADDSGGCACGVPRGRSRFPLSLGLLAVLAAGARCGRRTRASRNTALGVRSSCGRGGGSDANEPGGDAGMDGNRDGFGGTDTYGSGFATPAQILAVPHADRLTRSPAASWPRDHVR